MQAAFDTIYAWYKLPQPADLAKLLPNHATSSEQHWLFCLADDIAPTQALDTRHLPDAACNLANAMQAALASCSTSALHHFPRAWHNVHFWFAPRSYAAQLHTHFAAPIQWQDTPIAPASPPTHPTWQHPAPSVAQHQTPHVLIIGAGIAGAACAYECAIRGATVSVIEQQKQPAQQASGNRQGLLYAKISPHFTAQTELLLSGYGYTRHLLTQMQPQQTHWQACGVLHLNHNESERQRNQHLAQQQQHAHLYRAVSASEASQLAGIDVEQDGLFWQQGAWMNPAALIAKLLNHPNIQTHMQHTAQQIQHDPHTQQWHVHTQHGILSGSHIVFCTGAGSLHTAISQDFPLQIIRGQTSIAPATASTSSLKIALSAASYISPAWQGQHCFGATFLPKQTDDTWQIADEIHNRHALAQLNRHLFDELSSAWHDPSSLRPSERGHAALRCDAYDHLPAVGALGDVAAMRQIYAKLAHDKNYRIATPCPYLPNAYINTAHGSRGLATAPICAADIAAQICQTPRLLSQRLQQALNPNRLIIKKIVHS